MVNKPKVHLLPNIMDLYNRHHLRGKKNNAFVKIKLICTEFDALQRQVAAAYRRYLLVLHELLRPCGYASKMQMNSLD